MHHFQPHDPCIYIYISIVSKKGRRPAAQPTGSAQGARLNHCTDGGHDDANFLIGSKQIAGVFLRGESHVVDFFGAHVLKHGATPCRKPKKSNKTIMCHEFSSCFSIFVDSY